MFVKDIMTREVITLTSDTSLKEAAEILLKNNISGAPVIDEKGGLKGLLTEESLIFRDKKVHLPTFVNISMGFLTFGMHRLEEEIKKITADKVENVMEREIDTVSPEISLEDIATMMVEKERYYYPVVADRNVVGIITKRDIVRSLSRTKK
ncbi:MAG: CBS domain-containing protein [Candidatus Omnitrophica bacterium]|nr:CBS domain-containing protein [Candidatus Omnitrophota bacterium]MBD3269449.1 CBS domain-containing protein [Candidatus Omnitrophota bacterium]